MYYYAHISIQYFTMASYTFVDNNRARQNKLLVSHYIEAQRRHLIFILYSLNMQQQ